MDDATNVLNGGIEILSEMKASVTGVETMRARVQELTDKQQQFEKEINAKQKVMDSEIAATISKRQAEIEKSFDAQIDSTRDRMKRVRTKKDKLKDTGFPRG